MRFEIKRRYDHHELFVNGCFYGSYDTVKEAADEIDRISEEKNAGRKLRYDGNGRPYWT